MRTLVQSRAQQLSFSDAKISSIICFFWDCVTRNCHQLFFFTTVRSGYFFSSPLRHRTCISEVQWRQERRGWGRVSAGMAKILRDLLRDLLAIYIYITFFIYKYPQVDKGAHQQNRVDRAPAFLRETHVWCFLGCFFSQQNFKDVEYFTRWGRFCWLQEAVFEHRQLGEQVWQ